MHRPIFGHSFAVLVAPVLLSVLAFKFLNKKKTGARRNADVDIGTSGSMTASTGNGYDVFLSFRGLDTRKGFTDHLYNGLSDAGIDAFRDDEELHEGENIKPELLAAIMNSKILIPILSVNYGTSGWCLDELVQIMECKKNNGQIVLPIFYKVKPADVRHQIGSFGAVFRKREKHLLKRHSDQTILEKWKQALSEVGTLKGYEADGCEGKLVKSVVQKVLSELKKKFELVIPENLIGIDGHVEKVMKFVDDNSNATLFIGIHGMGGIGKTTLAKTIYNKLSDQFNYRSFIADIRESCKCNGLTHLQNQLIFDLSNGKNQVASNIDNGIRLISSKFKHKKVLILLDDVDDDDQLKALVGNQDWFSPGSRIFITTRKINVLDNERVNFTYEHEVMDKDHSMVLFSRHAFRRNSPPSEFEDLAHDAITTTGRLPLSLEVLGSLLCGKKLPFWRDTIAKSKKVPQEKVQKRLRISYEELDYGQKQIFLDIACFFIGKHREIISYMWDASGFFPEEGIEVLRFMSLIKIGDDHKFIMHDQLRDLGREIVREENQREPQYRSRLWDSKEVLKVLRENKGTDQIEGINLSVGNSESSAEIAWPDDNTYTAEHFKNLTSLRFLRLGCKRLSGDFKDSMKELRWLQWIGCPVNLELSNFHVNKLAVLDLHGDEINEKWEGWSFFTVAEKLKFLNLSCCFSLEDTDFLSAFKKLEVLILNSCYRLKRISASIGDMKALLRLELRRCDGLTELPAEIGNLKALQQLILEHTRSLSTLPDSVGDLENLEILDISYSHIEELPNGIGRLRNLREFNAFECGKLKGIMAKSMCDLSSLRRLYFHRCYELRSLPDLPSGLTDLRVTCRSRQLPSLSHLSHLKELRIWDCKFLECIEVLPSTLLKDLECPQSTDVEGLKSPQSLNTPFKLEFLGVYRCGSIETLDVSPFIHLKTLSIDYCENLLEVRGLDRSIYLESLNVAGCDSIERLDLPKFERLKKLYVYSCKKLAEIQGLDRLEFLESLIIYECTSIGRLDLPKSGRLKELNVGGCKNLAKIEGLDSLEMLDIKGWTSIGRLDLLKSGRLKELTIGGCENLAKIEGLDRLEYLERLNIEGCTSIGRLDLPKFGRLKKLKAGGCNILAEIEGLDRLEYLERLDIQGCTSIGRLDLPKSGRLKELEVGGCENLAEIKGLSRLEYLERLDIKGCTSIRRLDLPKSGRLKELEVRGCENLAEIEVLDSLERLDIEWCTSIGRLNLPKFGRLKKLEVGGCENLTEIEGLDSLERLDIEGCTSIGRLDLSKSRRLKKLKAGGCKNLAEIEGLSRLECLEMLDIKGCTSIGRLDLPKSGRLKILRAGGCNILAKIEGLDRLEYLERLYIQGCTSIGRLDLPKFGRLAVLKVGGCDNLAEIEGLDRLEYLERLDIRGCTSIGRLDLLKSGRLKQLIVEACKNLAEIQGLDRLEYLKMINISKCNSIKRLDLTKFGRLEELYVGGCENLAEIQDLDKLEFLKILDLSNCTSIGRLLLPKSKSLMIIIVKECAKLVEIQGLDRLEFLKELNIIGCKLLKKIPELFGTRIYQ